MFKITVNVQGLDKLKKHIDIVERLEKLGKSKKFQKYMQEKCLETVKTVTAQRLMGGTTNDDRISLYSMSHKIQEEDNGFVLYNDAKIPADYYNTLPFDTSGYPNGQFSIALAFEYGTGIVGITNYGTGRGYSYSEKEWYLPKRVKNASGIKTEGYAGFEIYRFTAEEIKSQLPKWVDDYIRKYGGISDD